MSDDSQPKNPGRRALLQGLGAASAALAFPQLWLPRAAYAQTAGRGSVKHLLYIRLAGGFRFTTAFNGDVDSGFNPFGRSEHRAAGTEWGVGKLLDEASWLSGKDDATKQRVALGMKRASELSGDMCVLPCVDHEPASGRADGNHGTGLERFLTGFVGGTTSFLTYVNAGLKDRPTGGQTLLPAFSLGEAGMALGAGSLAAYRPPVLDGAGFERFGFDAENTLPAWANAMVGGLQSRYQARLHSALRSPAEAYQQSRDQTRAYGKIFQDPLLKVANDATTEVDGISNRDLSVLLGTDTTGRRAALALRLFHFGCPAVFMNQGGYDMHSDEQDNLPTTLDGANRLLAGVNAALKKMVHPAGGTYWDHTLVVVGSEFGRTTGGQKFNSANGSDHGSDLATRWMSMPLMGGVIAKAGKGGKSLGSCRASDLKAQGPVYSYRAVLKTLLDLLGADHSQVFTADSPIQDLFR
ncbi:DUF1501 domain-containing protein [Aggregicoccus sp. 17bor-14]|uniref:DUF1501 domain-containing protein n=1 Tax=Myxococcaceae TaxID=31 RepID=UPI00129D1932|nr:MULTISPECIES: DUF1501 domain-containing protein [Myxococcaceae]MBF5042929.1 DUF1501 domain-containing protein [Simulacricoccus sp. 17bor-14]MRI88696.1 DUF1501 domain-containing protein [Aggregicoccus sp. 17bor-14]